MGYALESYENGLITPPTPEVTTPSVASLICKFILTPKDHIDTYLPKYAGVNNRSVYNVLIMIAGVPTSTRGHIACRIGASHRTVKVSVEQLLKLRYIKPVKRTRLIIPFNAYKQDTGYVLTVKGKMVLKHLLDY